ncbi:MAG: araC family transcriptional regulator [Moraxellaceae bacterium]|jgi:AraC-like DNA-binding protein|nr:araC family transcriptional regulator [Moraxellaceae bacterium]
MRTAVSKGQRSSLRSAAFPAIYLQLLCEVAEGFGVPPGDLQQLIGLSREQLREPDRLVPITAARAATQYAFARAGDRGLGFAYARALSVTLHGPISLIALTSSNLFEVVQALERYFTLRAPAINFHSEVEGDIVTLRVDYLRRDDPLRPFLMELVLTGLVVMTGQILDRPQTGAEVLMEGPEPAYFASIAAELPAPVRYGAAEYAIRIPRELLEAPLRLANPSAAALAREACERELQARRNDRQEALTARVRSLLVQSDDRLPTLEEVADTLHVSTRTLKRRLQEEGRNFRALVDHVLRERATQMLQEEGLSVSEVAFRLGYNDVSNFSRAFRRWTGQSPSDFRRER